MIRSNTIRFVALNRESGDRVEPTQMREADAERGTGGAAA